jgi:hypothetical protein
MKQIKDNKNRVYGIIGLIALFLMGCFIGFILNGSDRVNKSMMTERQCLDLQDQIMNMVRNVHQYDAQKIAQLDKMFSENCNNRDFHHDVKPVKVSGVQKEEKLPNVTCEAIEKLLKQELMDENSMQWQDHKYNSDVYIRLSRTGCEKNKQMYQQMAEREQKIAAALNSDAMVKADAKASTCEQIESLLQERLNYCDLDESDCRVRRAQIYANLSERGCKENVANYKELAKQELEIARALTDDHIEQNRQEATEMVETYKRLQMQAEAAKMIEKAKKLTNPAIDFIIQLEKIIEE